MPLRREARAGRALVSARGITTDASPSGKRGDTMTPIERMYFAWNHEDQQANRQCVQVRGASDQLALILIKQKLLG